MPSTKILARDKSGHEFYVHQVGGIMYPDYENTKDDDYEAILKKVRKLEMREDDIIAVGFPKSGNNWVFEIITMVLNQSTEYTTQTRREVTFDSATTETLDQWTDKASPRLFMSHLSMDTLPEQIASKKPRVIYIVRNFKDMAVSLYHFVNTLTKFICYKGKWEDFVDLQLSGQFTYGSWFDHVKMAEDFMQSHPDVPVHVLCYEKMKLNTTEEVQKLCQFLGKPDDLAEAIAKKVDFGTMKTEVEKLKFNKWNQTNTDQQGPGFLRKGIVGDWKNHFNEEQNKMVKEVFEKKLKGYSIGDMVRPYMEG